MEREKKKSFEEWDKELNGGSGLTKEEYLKQKRKARVVGALKSTGKAAAGFGMSVLNRVASNTSGYGLARPAEPQYRGGGGGGRSAGPECANCNYGMHVRRTKRGRVFYCNHCGREVLEHEDGSREIMRRGR